MEGAMKLAVLGVIFLSLSVFAKTDWSIKDSNQNIDLRTKKVQYADINYTGFLNGTRCISGSLKNAFKEISVQGAFETTLEKQRYNSTGLVFKVKGPVCIRYENGSHPDNPGNCVETKVRSRLVAFKACDENRKYFVPYKSPVVDFTQPVTLKKSPNAPQSPYVEGSSQYTDKFFGGSIQLEMTASVAYLNVILNSWQYRGNSGVERQFKEIQLTYTPYSFEGKNVRLKNAFSDFSTATQCLVQKSEKNYVLSCQVGNFTLGNIYLPNWAFSQIGADTDFSPVDMSIPGYSIRNAMQEPTLKNGIDFFSMSELWELLYSGNQVKGCVEYTVANVYGLPADLLNCNKGCARSITNNGNVIDYIHIDPNTGFNVYRTQTTCTKRDEDSFSGISNCLESKQTKNVVQIPFCS